MYFLGIDGGGTKTTCLVADEGLNEIYRTVGSSVNFYSEGLQKARANMKSMLLDIEKNTGVSRFDGVCVGSSALFGRADEKTKSAFCDGVFNCGNIIMDSDLFIALKATERENSAVIIAGTGSMAAGKNADGEIITKGGYGYILGDEGSGYRIALDGIHRRVGIPAPDKGFRVFKIPHAVPQADISVNGADLLPHLLQQPAEGRGFTVNIGKDQGTDHALISFRDRAEGPIGVVIACNGGA